METLEGANSLGAQLRAACVNDDLEEALHLIACGADVNTRNQDTLQNPLHIVTAAAGFDVSTAAFVCELCARGASVGARDAEGRTPLMLATREVGYGLHAVVAVKTLLSHGADPRAADERGWTALHHAGAGYADGCLYHAAAAADLADDVLKLRSVVRQLLDAGADPNARDSRGRSPLEAAAACANACAVVALLAEGVEPSVSAPPPPAKLVQRMAEVCRASDARRVAASATAAKLRLEVALLRTQIFRMESDQLANMGPGLRGLIVGAAAEMRRLQRTREEPARA